MEIIIQNICYVLLPLLFVLFLMRNYKVSRLTNEIIDHKRALERLQKESENRGEIIEELNEKLISSKVSMENEKIRQKEQLKNALASERNAKSQLKDVRVKTEELETSFNTFKSDIESKLNAIGVSSDAVAGNGSAEEAQKTIQSLNQQLQEAQARVDELESKTPSSSTLEAQKITNLNKEIETLVSKLNKKDQECG